MTLSFITDPPELRRARLKAAEAGMAYSKAKRAHSAYKALHRAWVMANAELLAAEARAAEARAA